MSEITTDTIPTPVVAAATPEQTVEATARDVFTDPCWSARDQASAIADGWLFAVADNGRWVIRASISNPVFLSHPRAEDFVFEQFSLGGDMSEFYRNARAAFIRHMYEGGCEWSSADAEEAAAENWCLNRVGDRYQIAALVRGELYPRTDDEAFSVVRDCADHVYDIYSKALYLASTSARAEPASEAAPIPEQPAPEPTSVPASEPPRPLPEVGDVFEVRTSPGFRRAGCGELIAVYNVGDGHIGFYRMASSDRFSSERIGVLNAIQESRIIKVQHLYDPSAPAPRRVLIVKPFYFCDIYFVTGGIYELCSDGRIYNDGTHICGAAYLPGILRILSQMAVPIGDDGHFVKAEDGASYRHLSPRGIVPDGITLAVDRAPASPITEVMLRNFFKIPPPVGAKTTEALQQWMRTFPPFPAWEKEPEAPSRSSADSSSDDEPSVEAEVSVCVEEEGRVSFTRVTRWTGTMKIPVHIIAEGEDAIREYIRDNYESEDHVIAGEPDDNINWHSADFDSEETTWNVDSQVNHLLDRAVEQHPALFDENGEYVATF